MILYKYTIQDSVNGEVFQTNWMSNKLSDTGGEKFIAPVTIDSGYHVSIYVNEPEKCRIIKIETKEIEIENI